MHVYILSGTKSAEGTKLGSLPSVSMIARGNRYMNTIMTHHAKGHNRAVYRIIPTTGMEDMVQEMTDLGEPAGTQQRACFGF